jgi:multidrug resistance efflux pump
MAVSFENTLRSLNLDSRRAGMFFVMGSIALLAVWSVLAFTVELPLSVASVDGRVVASAEPIEMTSRSREPVVAVPVRLGDRVNAGDTLIQFDSVPLELDLDELRQRERKFAEERESLRREITSQDAVATNAAEEQDRAMDRLRAGVGETLARIQHAENAERLYTELGSQKRIDQLTLSEARSNLEQSRKSLEAERAELLEKEAAKQRALSEIASNRARLEGKEAQLSGAIAELGPQIRQLERRIDESRLRAQFAGKIGAIAQLTVGQIVEPGAWLMTLVPEHGYEFQSHFVAAEAAGRVHVDQSARIEFFALPWTQYGMLDARVVRVGSEERDGRVEVDLELDKEASLYDAVSHGLKGRATVLVEEVTLARKLINLLGSPRVQR